MTINSNKYNYFFIWHADYADYTDFSFYTEINFVIRYIRKIRMTIS
jgi:hypothetical protein